MSQPLEQSWQVPARWRGLVVVAAPVVAIGAALAVRAVAPDLTWPATVTLAILLLSAILWATEAIPGVATALLAIALSVACLGLPAVYGAAWMAAAPAVTGWTQFIAPAGDPVMLLLLGSITLAEAARRTGVDRSIGAVILRPCSGGPTRLITGVMLASAWLSMWTSNTATAALMISMTRPLWDDARFDQRLRAGVLMAIALGANIGGLASPVGTPPNAIVFTRLSDLGHGLNFIQWVLIGGPVAIATLAIGWAAMKASIRWKRGGGRIDVSAIERSDAPPAPRWARRVTYAVFAITTLLWITGPWTHLPVSAVALVPLVVFPACGIVRPSDFAHLEWDVLLLILGGLVLGRAMENSGLAAQAVALLPVDRMSPLLIVGVMALAALVLSAFMSNTATANLLCPVGFAVAQAFESATPTPSDGASSGGVPPGWLITHVGLAIAMGAGNAMILPVSTPANALAARAGLLRTRDFLVVGTAAALAGVLGVVALAAMRS